ncbi:uncharacterized protein F5891DRAFT_1199129 [Suillus fuscotomentosus]|uniref:Uncharacterized protein n=1 Tax=Suillus fuscotomentosus TaxID=1912939 RepID=A0AAD4HD16_9AGAM|nr:uncharacterized protein F5891DRAFT_1199129 [Suillus fuscotomentosus]KAG1888898.1 hypothetical protein F5891DRAFT_1199129 [Suillus fuscotomentosus]
MAKQRQYLTLAIVPDSPTSADGDTTIIAALDSIFNDLDSTNSSDFLTQTRTDTEIEITELESAAATPSPPKAPTQVKCMQKPTKPKKKQKSAKNAPVSTDSPQPIKLTYNFSIFSASEYNKDFKKRSSSGKNGSFKLNTKPKKLDIKNYELSLSIPRLFPHPLPINEDDDYEILLECIRKHKDLTEKDEESKDKAPRGDDIDPANEEHNNNIKIICTRWVCHKKPGCHSDHCFVNPTDNIHFELGFSHFDCWAAAMCKGKEHATEDRPPNHHLFEALFENEDGPTKSLLTECRQQRNTVKNPRDPAAPVIHVNFPVDMFHGLHAGLPPVPPAVKTMHKG